MAAETNGRDWRREEQLAPLTGVAVLLFGLAGLIVLEGPADRPEVDVDASAFLAYFDQRDTVVLGSFLVMLSVAFFLWFLGSLRTALRDAEAGTGRLSAIAYGGGIATAALWLALPSVSLLGALDADHLDPQAAKTIFILGDAFLYPAAITAAVLVAASGLVALRTGALPRWLGWLSLVLAIWLLIPPLGSSAGTPENPAGWTGLAAIDLVPVWTAVTGFALMARRERA
ncbi:MAG TPA: hypothetical protein VFT79_03565 [Solirubrobacterales bacterium]|nr:hypothetical protein [Solirubrobacterales bacterium]